MKKKLKKGDVVYTKVSDRLLVIYGSLITSGILSDHIIAEWDIDNDPDNFFGLFPVHIKNLTKIGTL